MQIVFRTGCTFCGKGPAQGLALFRVNMPGNVGAWACAEHMDKSDPRVADIVATVEQSFQCSSGACG